MLVNMDMKGITNWLVAIGAINWGTTALGYDLVSYLGGGMLSSLVYYAVGLAGLYFGYNLLSGK